MSLETVTERRRRRIVEHRISGFGSGFDAIRFGNEVERSLREKVGGYKFRQYIGAPNTSLAITETWVGPTVLKTEFLELLDQHVAIEVCSQINRMVDTYNGALKVEQEVVREKPQPQFIGD